MRFGRMEIRWKLNGINGSWREARLTNQGILISAVAHESYRLREYILE